MILDDGVIEHQDLPFIRQIDVTQKQGEKVINLVGHGTGIASIMASKEFGLAPAATYVMVRIYDNAGVSTTLNFLDGVSAVLKEKKRHPTKKILVNMSLSTSPEPECNYDMMLAMAQLRKHDILAIVSAGNSNGNACMESPGCSADAFTVTASNRKNGLWDAGVVNNAPMASNFGACVDLAAPGENVKVINGVTGEPNYVGGTSASTAYVTAVAAILAGKGHGAEEIRKMLVEHSTKGRLVNVLHKVYNRLLYMNPNGTLPERQFYQDTTPSGPRKSKLPAGTFLDGPLKFSPGSAPNQPVLPHNMLIVQNSHECPKASIIVDGVDPRTVKAIQRNYIEQINRESGPSASHGDWVD
jgi:subtilisin family serine protease